MRTKTAPNESVDRYVKETKRKTRWQFSAEEKIRIVLVAIGYVLSASLAILSIFFSTLIFYFSPRNE